MIAHQPKVQLDWSSGDVLIPSSFRGHFWQPRTLLSMLCFLFFFWEEEERINGTESSNVHPTTSPSRQGLQGGSPHPPHAMQACHHPPPEPCNSNKEAAKALATAHPNRPSHPPRLLCTFLMNAIWLLAGALANSVMIPLVSRENLPPQQERPTTPCTSLQSTLGNFVPCASWQPRVPRHLVQKLPSLVHHLHAKHSPKWCPLPPGHRHAMGDHQPRPPICERPPMLLWEVHVALT